MNLNSYHMIKKELLFSSMFVPPWWWILLFSSSNLNINSILTIIEDMKRIYILFLTAIIIAASVM